MKKAVGIRTLLNSAWAYTSFYDNTFSIKNVLRDIIILICFVIFYSGNIGYIIRQYQHGGTFADVSFNLSTLISATFSLCTIYYLKYSFKITDTLFNMIDDNPYFSIQNEKNLRDFHFNNKIYRFLCIYALIVAIGGLLIIEMETCNDDYLPYACGYILPSVG